MQLASLFIFIALLMALAWIDFKTRLLPDGLTFSLLWLGLLTNPILQVVSLYDAVIGVVAGYLSLWVIYHIFKIVRQKEGLGHGDFKLLAALGAWLGWQALPGVLVVATGSTLLVLGLLKIKGRYPKDPHIPLGPGLCIAGLIFFMGKSIHML